ncbi:MAG: hypothetical protein AB8G15_22855 [Saprospiraceae bacterium]
MAKTISGTVKFQNLGMGFWGVIGDNGEEWRPVNMPEQLKSEGAKVKLKIEVLTEDMSMFMWGKAVKLISFHTLSV